MVGLDVFEVENDHETIYVQINLDWATKLIACEQLAAIPKEAHRRYVLNTEVLILAIANCWL